MPGRLIAIEGIDGSGKGTQAKRLCERLLQQGESARLISFPRYEQTLFGKVIGEFLNGRFGDLDDVHPFFAALLYAGDRFESRDELVQAIDECEFVILDRYVASNLAHQVTRAKPEDQAELLSRLQNIEHEIYGLPRPDLTVYLELPVEEAQRLISLKAARSYTDQKADIQESNTGYLERVAAGYRMLATDGAWRRVSCIGPDGLRSIDDLGDEVWKLVQSKT